MQIVIIGVAIHAMIATQALHGTVAAITSGDPIMTTNTTTSGAPTPTPIKDGGPIGTTSGARQIVATSTRTTNTTNTTNGAPRANKNGALTALPRVINGAVRALPRVISHGAQRALPRVSKHG